jgi:AbrB family looped-hinge helix DNA binding protein
MRTTVSTKGQIVLPAELRRRDGVEVGQTFEIERTDAGEYVLRRIESRPNQGLVALLRDCPVKGWFAPFDRTQTTDDLRPSDFE